MKRPAILTLMGLILFSFSLPALPAANEPQPAKITLSPETEARCLEVLREAIRSDEFWPSMHAAEALTLAGKGAEVRAIIEPKLKTEKDDQHRCGLARELVRAGDRSKAVILFQILAGKDPHGHIHACESLYKVNELGDGILIREALKSDNPKKSMMAAALLCRWGNPEAFQVVRKYLNDPDVSIASIAAWIIARVGDKQDIPALKANLKRTDDPFTRAYFETALAMHGDPEGLQAVQRNLSSDNAAVKTYSAIFAGESGASNLKEKLKKQLNDTNRDARIRAAQALIVLAKKDQYPKGEIVVNDVYEASKEYPRYSEGSILPLNDGTLLYATTQFIGSGSDFATARIIAKKSPDGGRTWSKPHVLQENTGKKNVMSATLRYLAGPMQEKRPIGLFYLKKNTLSDLKAFLKVSHDNGKTFGPPIEITTPPGYHVMNNDRITILSSGRWLAPVASTPDVHKSNHFVCTCFISDDQGKTWRQSKGSVDYAKRGAMEPEVFELKDGKVLMIFRTQSGHIGSSISSDKGEHWSKPGSWGVRAPEAPATLRRIPSTGDLMLIWNDNFEPGAGHSGKRTPLTVAISNDEGQTWKLKKNLETDPDQTYSYISLTFHQGRAIMSYYVGDPDRKISSRFRSIPLIWFYQPESD
ncbi:exo-alpha-sialidase [uncultured Gimesia sp.]|uniref:exo-alpha-sialidase n=1 Tax=uncultured Gimesia sp. TaxID=1678688 RepID=UPI0030D7D5DF|tara:strand:- start:90907 stop:92838 length:1932 start_codon:yes stop_codon:yes gene_type:complete